MHHTSTAVGGLLSELEPRTLSGVIGQPELVEALRELVDLSMERHHPLPAVLLVGPDGVGKRAVARALIGDMRQRLDKVAVHRLVATELIQTEELCSLLERMGAGDVFVVEEVHRLSPNSYAQLARAIDEFRVSAESIESASREQQALELPPFTVIGTSEVEMDRFGAEIPSAETRTWISLRVVPYTIEDMMRIARASVCKLGGRISDADAEAVARRSRGMPRHMQILIARYASEKASGEDGWTFEADSLDL